MVCARAQSDAVELLLPLLTQEEEAVYRRGRNAHSASMPKHADPAQYRRATGLEALFGYLYLSGQEARMRELFGRIAQGDLPESGGDVTGKEAEQD